MFWFVYKIDISISTNDKNCTEKRSQSCSEKGKSYTIVFYRSTDRTDNSAIIFRLETFLDMKPFLNWP